MSTTLKPVAGKIGNAVPRTVEGVIGKDFSFDENCPSACNCKMLNFLNYGNQDRKERDGTEHEGHKYLKPFMYNAEKWPKTCEHRKIFEVCLTIFRHYA